MNLVMYDWVSITSKIHIPQNFIELLGMQDVSWELVKGARGYMDRLYWGSISIHYNGREDMGVWLEMSGQGCRSFETFGNGDYESLFDEVRQNPGEMNLTRLDVAFDDHEGLLDFGVLLEDTRSFDYVSKARRWDISESWDDLKRVKGYSIYHGRKVSEILIRIYDKAAERGFDDGRHWIRVELQLRDSRALAFLDAPGEIGVRFSGVLRNYLRYVDPDDFDSNKWRWPMKWYWEKLLGAVAPIRLYTKPGAEYNLSNLEDFVYKQAGGAVATLLEIVGEEKFRDGLRQRGTQLNPKYKQLLDQYGIMSERKEVSGGRVGDL